jgi:hypothetical protein
VDVQPQRRVRRLEPRQQRRQHGVAEARRRGDAQGARQALARQRAQRALGRLRGFQHVACACRQAPAGVGQAQRAGGAGKQRLADRCFDLAHPSADRGARDAQHAPRRGKAAGRDDAAEELERRRVRRGTGRPPHGRRQPRRQVGRGLLAMTLCFCQQFITNLSTQGSLVNEM